MQPRGRGVATAGVLSAVPVEQVRPSPYQPRRQFDEARLAELAATVREHGVVQPVVVRPVAGGYELVAGERRWRAARMAGLVRIPAVVRELSDQESALLGLVENLQRDELQFFDEAQGYRRLMDEFKVSQEEVADWVGRSQPAVANKLRLLRLETEVRERVVAQGLSERHARALLRLEGLEPRLAAVDAFAVRRMTVAAAEAWVERALAEAGGRARTEPAEGGADAVHRAFASAAGGLRRAGYRVRLTESRVGEAWEVRARVTEGKGAAPARRRRA